MEIIKIKGARQHNLKNVSVEVPKNKLVVFTGVSGSGKSSLAYDTIYAEGQRRYVESLSTYARQFLGIMDKPDVDLIEGLSPAISIDQKTTSKNPRSTVGTVTEVYDYLRLLFARAGHPHCPICGKEISSQSTDEIVESIILMINEYAKNRRLIRFLLLSPMVVDKKGEFSSLFDNLKAKGFTQVRVDNYIKDLSEDFVLIKTNKHTIEAVVDRVSFDRNDLKDKIFSDNLKSRISNSVEQSLKLSDGLLKLSFVEDKTHELPQYPKQFMDHLISQRFACPVDNIQIPEIEPRTFSFNSPHGACEGCTGLGNILKVEPGLILSKEISITEGGILPFGNIFEHDTWYSRLILRVCEENDVDARTSIKNLSKNALDLILYGTGNRFYRVLGKNKQGHDTSITQQFIGVIAELERRHKNTESDWIRAEIEKYMRETPCDKCEGARLKKEALSITVDSMSISEICAFNIELLKKWIDKLSSYESPLSEKERSIVELILKEISTRLSFLVSVGLEYLTLDRTAGTLAGGEAQRIRLASQIGSGLTGVLYVLDEPTIGLHAKDNYKLIKTLKKLRDLGNSVLVVEHDEETINSADHIIDFGPGAGAEGGEVVYVGDQKGIKMSDKSITGKFLSGRRTIDISKIQFQKTFSEEKKPADLIIKGCSQYNLKNINVRFPLNKLVAITGVSGSGKSTLLVETLYPALSQKLNSRFRGQVGKHKIVEGIDNINSIILIDQSPIGRTPRSNPATYTKLFDHVREVFASTRQAKINGFKKGRFSFNVREGRCGSCEGQGRIKIEMQFMSDIWINCDVCHGKRYNAQTLEITYKGKDISQVLQLSVDEAIYFFHAHPQILRRLETLKDVGLGYIELGQSATTLSGGEAQRIKLAHELSKKPKGNTVYVLDEPTTGLHFADVEKLLIVLKLLVERGNSVFIIEHNMDVIKNADWVIDLGPGGGENGGKIVAEGSVNDMKISKYSETGRFLKKIKY